MPLDTVVVTTDVQHGLAGNREPLLSADAITDPGQHLFGATAAEERATITYLLLPRMTELEHVRVFLAIEPGDARTYGITASLYLLRRKDEPRELVANDLSANNIGHAIVALGMPAGIKEGHVDEIIHRNTGVSRARASFHLLHALLDAIIMVSNRTLSHGTLHYPPSRLLGPS